MTKKTRVRKASHDRRRDIVEAAGELFSKRGFRGTTTRALAAAAGSHEAVLFRHFGSKEKLYSAALESRLSRNRQSALDEMEACAKRKDDRGFFEALARGLLRRFENDSAIPRLILFSALERHEPAAVVRERQLRVEEPTRKYISMRIRDGVFRKMDPEHAVIAFGAMLFGYVVRQDVLGMSAHKSHKREKILHSFVTIFLAGLGKREK